MKVLTFCFFAARNLPLKALPVTVKTSPKAKAKAKVKVKAKAEAKAKAKAKTKANTNAKSQGQLLPCHSPLAWWTGPTCQILFHQPSSSDRKIQHPLFPKFATNISERQFPKYRTFQLKKQRI